MPKFTIIEFDRDYRTKTGSKTKEFPSLKAAEDWCNKESWTGYDYFVDRKSRA